MPDAKIISASPYRAVLRMDSPGKGDKDDSDSDFDREELPSLKKSRFSPIKDDSEILRSQKDEFLNSFSKGHRDSMNMTVKSERPLRQSDDGLRGIIINP